MGGIIPELKGKIVFFDFDGVLGTYQATKNNVHIDDKLYVARHILDKDVFKYARAPKVMQAIVASLNPETTYVLSATASSFEESNKIDFLTENYPSIKRENIIFVGSSNFKVLIMRALYEKLYSFDRSKIDMVLVEDTIEVIQSVEREGFKCYHISSFLE